MEINELRDSFSIQINLDREERGPRCETTKKIVKGMLFTTSIIIGNVIAYPGTLKKGNVAVLILTNGGIFGAYGTLGAWGLYMFW